MLGGHISGRCSSKVYVQFSRKINLVDTPLVYINNLAVASCETHKHLGLLLDKRLAFDHHIEEMILRANKDIGHITRLRRYLQRNSLLTIYKAFIRPHVDYGDVVSDYPGNACFVQKLESVQYNTSLTVTGCFQMYAILYFTRPVPIPMFKINRLSGFFFLTRLRVGFSHLREHKFRHVFLDIVDFICSCRTNAIKNTEHYLLLHCCNFANQSTTLFYDL